ncbi:MAG: RNA repair domain-containing protein [Desulfurococcaceae archaeon]
MTGKKRGEIENWLKKVFFHGPRNEYVVYIRFRTNSGLEYRAIPVELIDDIRDGYIVIGDDKIPYHRVVFIKKKNGSIVYSRLSSGELDPST